MKTTVVILTPGFPADESDVNCLPYFQTFVRAINRDYPQLRLAIIATQYPYRKDQYEWFGNLVISLNTKNSSKWQKPLTWLKVIRQVNKIRKDENFAGVLCFWCLEEALIGRLISSLRPTLLRIWICGQDAKAHNPWVKWMRPQADELVANSYFIQNVFEKNHSVKPQFMVPNSIDPNSFPPLPSERLIDLISVGSLITLKQTHIVLKVAKELTDLGLRPRVTICGNGPEEPRLRALAKELMIEELVEFKGELSHGETISLMQQAKILLHPSSFEGYSTVCLEALYAGCEVVSFIAAEENAVDHWHVVTTEDDMAHTCARLLNTPLKHERLLLHSADDSARKMLELFNIT